MYNKADEDSSQGLLRINKLRELNLFYQSSQKEFLNKRIYRLLYCRDVYISAYDKIKSNKGATTHSSDKSSMDGISLNRIDKLIEQIKTEKWQPRLARRVDIKSGQLRPLGIQGPEEKIIQEIVRMILEAIYEPYFLNCSHGFRKDKSGLTALNSIRENFDGVSYIIEGDITKCYDRFNHDILIALISRRVKDQKFINLIYKLVKAGYLIHKKGKGKEKEMVFPNLGTPQGSVLSPLLANIYLHELDKYITQRLAENENNVNHRRNPIKAPVNTKIKQIESQLKLTPRPTNTKLLIKQLKETKIKAINIPPIRQKVKGYYLRYADDWVIGINGPITLAKKLKADINTFLKERLRLDLNLEKTRISDIHGGEKVLFLGYEIKRQSRGRIIKMRLDNRSSFYKGTTGHKIKLRIPVPKLVTKLFSKGFCDEKGFPLAYKKWSVYDDHIILRLFNTVRSGLLNYYCLADNSNSFFRLDYILRFSLAKTLAHRHRSSIRKIVKKHGKIIEISYTNSKGNSVKSSMPTFKNYKPTLKSNPKIDSFTVQIGRLTRSKLGSHCCIICANEQVEMHHIKQIRKRKNNKEKETFTTFMGSTVNKSQCVENVI
jgi:group II intron reverse transcriptase/maturase